MKSKSKVKKDVFWAKLKARPDAEQKDMIEMFQLVLSALVEGCPGCETDAEDLTDKDEEIRLEIADNGEPQFRCSKCGHVWPFGDQVAIWFSDGEEDEDDEDEDDEDEDEDGDGEDC